MKLEQEEIATTIIATALEVNRISDCEFFERVYQKAVQLKLGPSEVGRTYLGLF